MTPDRTPSANRPVAWVKSTYSGAEGGDCLEVATGPDRIHVRDSKDTARPGLAVGRHVWAAFIGFAAERRG
jgi:hypothetical protein